MKYRRWKSGSERIVEERLRQVMQEGWTAEHDDEHDEYELSRAARAYTAPFLHAGSLPLASWPWDKKWWKPSNDAIRNLTKAGALIAAEIDRLLRLRDKQVKAARPLPRRKGIKL